MKSGNKRTGSKKSAVAALCVVLVLTILIGVIGFTGLAIPPRGLYKVRSWLPTADSEKWPESLSLGLDLRGGMYVEYSGKAPEGSDASFDDLVEGTISIIRARLTDRGFTEANVQRIGTDGIRVEVPGVQDDSVLDLIGAAAKMRFLDPEGNEFMTGDKVKSARAKEKRPAGLGAGRFLFLTSWCRRRRTRCCTGRRCSSAGRRRAR